MAHWPQPHSSPRGRWYLNDRLKVRLPDAYSADAIVSPSNAAIGLPSKVKLIARRAVDPLAGLLGQARHVATPSPPAAGAPAPSAPDVCGSSARPAAR